MVRTRLTWLVIGGVVALLVVASVDAIRSSDAERPATLTTSPTTSRGTTTGPDTGESLPTCARGQLAVSIGIVDGVATTVLRHVEGRPCSRFFASVLFAIFDRGGHRIGHWALPLGGTFRSGTEITFRLPGVARCDRRGPFVAVATAGPYTARRGGLSRREITCSGAAGARAGDVSELEMETYAARAHAFAAESDAPA